MKTLVKLDQYDEKQWPAEIVFVKEISRAEHLGPRVDAFRAAMRMPDTKKAAKWTPVDFEDYKDYQLSRKGLVVGYKVHDIERDEYMVIPQASGYNKSNLKAVRDKNPDLHPDTTKWVGESIWVQLDSNDYYELAK